jgi:hypothetical protein
MREAFVSSTLPILNVWWRRTVAEICASKSIRCSAVSQTVQGSQRTDSVVEDDLRRKRKFFPERRAVALGDTYRRSLDIHRSTDVQAHFPCFARSHHSRHTLVPLDLLVVPRSVRHDMLHRRKRPWLGSDEYPGVVPPVRSFNGSESRSVRKYRRFKRSGCWRVLSGKIRGVTAGIVDGAWRVGECPEKKGRDTSYADLEHMVETETVLVVERLHHGRGFFLLPWRKGGRDDEDAAVGTVETSRTLAT